MPITQFDRQNPAKSTSNQRLGSLSVFYFALESSRTKQLPKLSLASVLFATLFFGAFIALRWRTRFRIVTFEF
jgi:hypothetical protein